jgi:hypothetical protein
LSGTESVQFFIICITIGRVKIPLIGDTHHIYALPEGDADEVDSDDEDEGDDENKLLRYDTFIKPHIFVLYIQ